MKRYYWLIVPLFLSLAILKLSTIVSHASSQICDTYIQLEPSYPQPLNIEEVSASWVIQASGDCVTWQVRTWHHSGGSKHLMAQSQYVLPCMWINTETPLITAPALTFNGDGITCQLPQTFRDEAFDLFDLAGVQGPDDAVEEICDCNELYGEATIVLPDVMLGSLPLLHYDNIFNFQVQSNDVGQLQTVIDALGRHLTSPWFPHQIGSDNNFFSGVTRNYNNGVCQESHMANGTTLANNVTSCLPPKSLNSDDVSSIYIGYNPLTETYFEGEIKWLEVDPPCRYVGKTVVPPTTEG